MSLALEVTRSSVSDTLSSRALGTAAMSSVYACSFVISDHVSTASSLDECSFGGKRYRGSWKGASVDVLDVFDIVENHEEFLELFLQLMEEMITIRHPNVAQVYGVGLGGELRLPIVSEILFVTLKDRLGSESPMTHCNRVDVLYGVLNGLKFLHESTPPVIHGLLTADSVWMSRDVCQVKITHICMARLLVEKGRPSCFLSAQHYLAPEVVENWSSLSTSADVYSYGVLVLKTVTGEPNHTFFSAAEESMCFRREQSLLSVVSECLRSASERPTAQEIMNICFQSAGTNAITREDLDHCTCLDEETLESTGPLNSFQRLQIESESLEETQLSDETTRTDIVASSRLSTSSLQDEESRVVQSLQDTNRFNRLREISERYLSISNGGSSLLNIGCIPEWHYRHDFPHPGETVMAVIDGKILTGHRARNEMYITDCASGELLQTAIFPDSGAAFDGIFISDGKIFSVFVDEVTWQLSVHTYSLTDDKWTLVCERPPNIELAAIAFTVVGDRIFLAGGYNRRWEKVANVFMFNTTTREWLQLPNMPTARCSCSSFIYHGCICYAAGGGKEGVRSKSVELMSLDNYEWTSLPSTTTAGGAVTTIHDTLVATGGIDDSGTVSRRVEFWDYPQKLWMPLPKLSQGRFGHGMAVDVDGDHSRIIVTGGYDKNRHKTRKVEVIEF